MRFEELCDVILPLPGVERSTSYGTPALKARGKVMVRLREDLETVVVHVDLDEREVLLAAAPEIYFVTDHYQGYPCVLARLAAVGPEQAAEIADMAWRHCQAGKERKTRGARPKGGRSGG